MYHRGNPSEPEMTFRAIEWHYSIGILTQFYVIVLVLSLKEIYIIAGVASFKRRWWILKDHKSHSLLSTRAVVMSQHKIHPSELYYTRFWWWSYVSRQVLLRWKADYDMRESEAFAKTASTFEGSFCTWASAYSMKSKWSSPLSCTCTCTYLATYNPPHELRTKHSKITKQWGTFAIPAPIDFCSLFVQLG